MAHRNRIGNLFSLTSFGESHGAAIGGVIDGMPAGVKIDMGRLAYEMSRRRPGQSALTTARREDDAVELLSGVFNGVTLGTPIGFVIRNKDHRSADYDEIAKAYRPNHADYTYDAKFGVRDYRGGGRASARETAARVVAGSLARQALETVGITITAYTAQIGHVALLPDDAIDVSLIERNVVRCPHAARAELMADAIADAQRVGDTLGGRIVCRIDGVPAGLGEPVFGRLNAQLAEAMMSINAAKAFEIGDGFDFASARGSEVLDEFVSNADGRITTASNHSGGIQGGISNGSPITMSVVFKPIATLMRDLPAITPDGRDVTLPPRGRHDVCVVPRAVPVVEAMAAIVMLDNYLMARTARM